MAEIGDRKTAAQGQATTRHLAVQQYVLFVDRTRRLVHRAASHNEHSTSFTHALRRTMFTKVVPYLLR